MKQIGFFAIVVGVFFGTARSFADDAAKKKADAAADHWSFQPIERPDIPQVARPDWVKTPVDAFILSKLEAEKLKPTESADPRTLLRRVCFDLTGLPPTPQQVREFLHDVAVAEMEHKAISVAYARLVDRLLASPQYGERWARFWLDVVRYAETNGYERDGDKPFAWKYRDYVIKTFNNDKPFDRFVVEQIAGDELPDADRWSRIATTFLRLGTWDDEPADPAIDRCDQLDDVLGTTTAAFMAQSLRCARCHDHKFEPFTQKDYYSVLAMFTPLVRPQEGRTDKTWPVAEPKAVAAWQRASLKHEARISELESAEKKIREGIRNRLAKPGKKVSDKQIAESATPTEKKELARVATDLANARAARPAEPEMGYIWREEPGKTPKTHILKRGDPTSLGMTVEPAVPGVLQYVSLESAKPNAKSTNRRLAFARWLVRKDNPLLARVFVNRIWQQHFGEGIVASENDFGVVGDVPTHPELLDWLAAEFISSGFKIKNLHRTIVMSNTYRQSSLTIDKSGGVDTAALVTLLGSWRQRRLSAEMIRDAMLSASGELNLEAGGPSVFPPMPRAVFEGQSRPGEGWQTSNPLQSARRSIYVYAKRSIAVPELDLLDAPDTTCTCEQRSVSTTGVQALTFLNGSFAYERATAFARRLRREVPTDAEPTIRRAFEIALTRQPDRREIERCSKYLSEQSAAIAKETGKSLSAEIAADRALIGLCLVLLNSNEFVTWN